MPKESANRYSKDDKRQRFERLAVHRTNEIIRKLKILGNCSSRSTYAYSEVDVNKIFSEIERQVRAVRAKFYFPKNKGDFKL